MVRHRKGVIECAGPKNETVLTLMKRVDSKTDSQTLSESDTHPNHLLSA